MLRLKNLDDRTFETMLEEAKQMIPVHAPQWTDTFAHDPGITFLELFTWLAEMQQYYLNRVTARNELKFLKLLGVQLRERASARTDVTFSYQDQTPDGVPLPRLPLHLPRGTKLLADQLPFETEVSLTVLPAEVQSVYVHADGVWKNYTMTSRNKKAQFPAFGQVPMRGNRLLIGFDQPLPTDVLVRLTLMLHDDLRPMATTEARRLPSGRVQWSYYAIAENGEETWLPLDKTLHDRTLHLHRSGRLSFVLKRPMAAKRWEWETTPQASYWLRCVLLEEGYEQPPVLEEISLNRVTAVQRDTKSEVFPFRGRGRRHQTLTLDHHLVQTGHVDVQVLQPDHRWRDWHPVADLEQCGPDAESYQFIRSRPSLEDAENTSVERTEIQLLFGDGIHGKRLPFGQGINVRVVACAPDFMGPRVLGVSNGLPDQRFLLPDKSFVDGLLVQVSVRDEASGALHWEDWTEVDDLDHSGPDDLHYWIDHAQGQIVFGNDERGRIPEAPAPHDPGVGTVRLLAFRAGGGTEGNVHIGRITAIDAEARDVLRVTNGFFATGGEDRETLPEAKRRVRSELERPTRLVTAEDAETLALTTPGLRVMRAKALPPGAFGPVVPHRPEAVTMMVVVMPHGADATAPPVPSEGFCQTVQQHLEPHRLLTTAVKVIGPAYVKVTVHADVVVEDGHSGAVQTIERLLHRLLRPFDDSESGAPGWEFGRAVTQGEILQAISAVPGVRYVESLALVADGAGQRLAQGDLVLPPHGLVVSGDHQVRAVRQGW